MNFLKYIFFPLIVFILFIYSIFMLIIATGAMTLKVFGEAYFTLREIYRD
jgi:hypothetical protein